MGKSVLRRLASVLLLDQSESKLGGLILDGLTIYLRA